MRYGWQGDVKVVFDIHVVVLVGIVVLVVLGLCAKPYVAGDDDLEKGKSIFVVKTLHMHFF